MFQTKRDLHWDSSSPSSYRQLAKKRDRENSYTRTNTVYFMSLDLCLQAGPLGGGWIVDIKMAGMTKSLKPLPFLR